MRRGRGSFDGLSQLDSVSFKVEMLREDVLLGVAQRKRIGSDGGLNFETTLYQFKGKLKKKKYKNVVFFQKTRKKSIYSRMY